MMKIIGLTKDKKGLLARAGKMKKGYYHVHSNELTPEQKRVHKKLLSKYDQRTDN